MIYTSVTVVLSCMILGKIVRMLFKRVDINPVLYYVPNGHAEYILKKCESLTKPFSPPYWMKNRHLQTLLPSIIHMFRNHGIIFKREFICVDDGENVALDWAMLSNSESEHEKSDIQKNIILVLPGLMSDRRSFTGVCLTGIDNGFLVAVLNKRGHGGSRLTKPFLRGFGDGSDLHSVLKILKDRYPDVKIGVIGSSAGSAVVGCHIGKHGDESLVDACVSFSAGYAVERLFTYPPYSRLYEYLMVEGLKKHVIKPNIKCLGDVVDEKEIKKARTIYDIEKEVYCKGYGYSDMAEYWENNEPLWRQVDCPRLFINSMDDPICVSDLIPFDQFCKIENVFLLATDIGGHCGFIENLSGIHWIDKVAVDYIKSVLDA